MRRRQSFPGSLLAKLRLERLSRTRTRCGLRFARARVCFASLRSADISKGRAEICLVRQNVGLWRCLGLGRPAVWSALGLSLLAVMPTVVSAQTALTLADATGRAIAKNRDIVIERESANIADANIERAQGAYDPVLRGEARYRDSQVPTTSLLSGAPEGELAPHFRGVTSSASLTQLLPNGATLAFNTATGFEQTNNFLTLISPAWTTQIGVEARLPLLQNRAIDPSRRAIRVAQIGKERSTLALRRTLLETVNAVEQAYWTLVAAQRDVDIKQQSVALAEQQRADVQARIDGKTVPESDIAQPTAEIGRRRGDLYASEEARARAERALKLLMLENETDPLWDTDLRAVDAPDVARVDGQTSAELQAALKDATELRPELADVSARLKQQDIDIEAAIDRLKPQLDLVASYTARGLSGSKHDATVPFAGIPVVFNEDFDGGPFTSLENLGRMRFPDASVGVQVSIPLGNRVARADVAVAQSTRKQTLTLRDKEAQRIAVEVRNAVTGLQTASQRLEAARGSREAAQVQLQAEQDRFEAGLTTTFLVLTRQNDLAAAQVAETTALTAYRRGLAELARARGTLLRDRGITVEENK
jgi:outer membrane protein